MKKLFALLILGIIGCKSKQSPILVVDNPNYKFDTCKVNERIVHVFNLKNTGNADLVISKIHTTCNCTVVFMDSIKLKPSEKTGIKVEYNPSLFKDSGLVMQKVVLRNNSDSAIVFLTLSGYVLK